MSFCLAGSLLASIAFGHVGVPGRLSVTAVNPLPIARTSQTIELTRDQLAPLGAQDFNRIRVTDAAGRRLITQAVDTDYDAYHQPDVLIFQSNFGPRERKRFTVTIGAPAAAAALGLSRLWPLRARTLRRLRVGERCDRAPDVWRCAGDVEGRAADVQRDRHLIQAPAEADRR